MPKIGFHGHVEEAYLRFVDKKLKEKRAAMGINPLIRDIYIKIESQEAKSGAPLSPVLSPYGLNVAEFVNQFNKQSEQSAYGSGVKIPTIINVFENKTLKFQFTTLFSYYIISNNNNRYKAIKAKEMYKKLLMVNESRSLGKAKVWSEPHELYSKTESKVLNYFDTSRRKENKKKKKRQKTERKIEEKRQETDIKKIYKTMLGTLQSNRIIVYTKLFNFLKGNLFKPQTKNIKNFEDFVEQHNNIFLGNYNKKISKYKIRQEKLKEKNIKNYRKWQAHRDYLKEIKEKQKKKTKSHEKRKLLKFTYNNK